MIRIGARFLSSSNICENGTLAQTFKKISPKLAAIQFPPADASRSKIQSLKRKEDKLKRKIIRDVNNLKQYNIKQESFQVDPVLGSPQSAFVTAMKEEINNSSNMAYGHNREDFEKLVYGAQKAALDSSIGGEIVTEKIIALEEKKKAALLTILNPRNSNEADKKKLAIAFARKEFQRFDGDTGSPEVQAAISTVKIHFGFEHVRSSPKDKHHIQRVRELVQGRQRILRYLKADDPERYFYTIKKLGLTDDVICAEFSMGKQYFQDYKVWGDKVLIKLSDKQNRKKQKYVDLQKQVQEYNRVAKEKHEILSNSK